MRVASTLVLLVAVSDAYPSHYHSCTFNFTGGRRLPFPYCAYNSCLALGTLFVSVLRRTDINPLHGAWTIDH